MKRDMVVNEAGLEDSAILLMSLGETEAAAVFRHLRPSEVQSLGEAMARMTSVPKARLEDVLRRFTSAASSRSPLAADTGNYVRNVLKKALEEDKANLLIDRILQDDDNSGMEGLKWMDAETIGEMLREEHPQIVAVVLVHLDCDQAVAVLKTFTTRHRNEVLVRVATLERIEPSALKELSEVMRPLIADRATSRLAPLGGVKTAANLLSRLGTSIETTALDFIRKSDHQLAQRVVDNLLTFDDLMRVDNRGILALLKEVQSESLVVALKGAQPALRERFLSNMSTRAADTLREELDSRGPVRVAEVQAEQRELMKTVRRLAEEGQLVIGYGSGDGYVE
ncbi:MAG: flagellar motor switch protein FliG [Caldimonas sp.]